MAKLIEIRNNISQLPFLSLQDQLAEYEEEFRSGIDVIEELL